MSSNLPQPEDDLFNDDSGTYRISESGQEPLSPREAPPPKKKKRRKKLSSSSENPFEVEFERQAREAERAARTEDNDSDDGSSEIDYPAKRTRIVDTTKKPSESLFASFLYPFFRNGIGMILAYSFFIFIGQLAGFLPVVGGVIQTGILLLVAIFIGLMLLETANDTLQHMGGGIEWPDIGLDSLGAGVAATGALLVALIPMVALIWYLASTAVEGEERNIVARLFLFSGALSLGLLYLPMSFIALAELENEKAFNPILVFSRIFQMFGSYISIVGVILVLFLGLNYLLFEWEQLKLYNPKILELVSTFIRLIAFVYLSTVLIRAVGLSFSKHGLSFELEEE